MTGAQSELVKLPERERSASRRQLDSRLSSATDRWATPAATFAALDAEFHFGTDVCALPENAKCAKFFSPDDNGLVQEWAGVCWMNPPYGRNIWRWIQKAHDAAEKGATVVCLVPARVDTDWWHRWVMPFAEVRFLRGRLRFGNAKNSAPFPVAVVIFRPPTAEGAE